MKELMNTIPDMQNFENAEATIDEFVYLVINLFKENDI